MTFIKIKTLIIGLKKRIWGSKRYEFILLTLQGQHVSPERLSVRLSIESAFAFCLIQTFNGISTIRWKTSDYDQPLMTESGVSGIKMFSH